MTPLFPKDNAAIEIKQGNTGDCYLLAALDCLYNFSPECRAKLRAMFQEKSNGDVEIRIKHSNLVQFRNPAIIRAKYQFREGVCEDIITIPKAQLENIDKGTNGAQSNSLAVKILERISSYYFTGQLDHQKNPDASLAAHDDVNNRHSHTATQFMNQLLNVFIEETPIDNIIRYKLTAQDEPVYIEMDHGQIDAHGKFHGYHALRLQKILENPRTPGGYDFVLVNPWDTSKTETYSIRDIKSRRPRVCIVSGTLAQNQFNWSLIYQLPAETARYIFASRSLYQLLWYVKQKNGSIDFAKINDMITLYRQAPFTVEQLHNLSGAEKDSLFSCLISSDSLAKKSDFINTLLKNPRVREFEGLVQKAIQEKSKDYVEKNLCHYYFKRIGFLPTRAGNLRKAFHEKFDCSDIESLTQFQPQLILTGLQSVIYDCVIPEYAKNFIKNWKDELTEKQFTDVMQELEPNTTCIQFFQTIYSLHKLNPRLGEAFFKFALNELPTRFKTTPGELKTQIDAKGQTPFSQWFDKLNTSALDIQLKEKALIADQEKALRNVINSAARYIKNIKVNFSTSDINQQRADYLKEINTLMNGLRVKHAKENLGYGTRVPSALLDAQKSKISEIESKYAQAKTQIDLATFRDIINQTHLRISQFSCNFPDFRNRPQLIESYNEKLRQLSCITNEPNYLNALKKMNYTENPPFISEVMRTAKQTITQNFHDENAKIKRIEAQNLLIQSGLLAKLDNLKSKVANLEKKYNASPKNYKEARDTAKALHLKLKGKCEKFDDISKIKNFKEKCEKAIKKAQPVLEKHRGCKEILAVIASILVTIGTGTIANIWAGKLLLFKPSTKSMEKVDDFRDTLNLLPDSPKP